MSYYTKVELSWLEEELENPERLRGDLERIVAAAQYSEDVVGDFMDLLADGSAEMSLYAEDVTAITAQIAKLVPHCSFSVRGCGESVRDIWLRDYNEGQEVFALGPPENAI